MHFIPVHQVKKALNKAWLAKPVERAELERFKAALNHLFDSLDETESEEHCKNLFAEFLKDAYYRDRNAINTMGRVDLVIHAGTRPGEWSRRYFIAFQPRAAFDPDDDSVWN